MSDLQAIGVRHDWYQRCQDRDEWYAVCRDGVTMMAIHKRKNNCSANVWCCLLREDVSMPLQMELPQARRPDQVLEIL